MAQRDWLAYPRIIDRILATGDTAAVTALRLTFRHLRLQPNADFTTALLLRDIRGVSDLQFTSPSGEPALPSLHGRSYVQRQHSAWENTPVSPTLTAHRKTSSSFRGGRRRSSAI